MFPSSSSGFGSETLEAVALVHSKKISQKEDADIHKVHVLVRKKKKLPHQQTDQKLKEQAASNRKDNPVFARGLGIRKLC